MQLILGSQKNVVDVAEIVEEGNVLLGDFSTRGGRLHQDDGFMLCAMLLSDLVNYAFSRTEEQAQSRPFFVFLDEGHRVMTQDVADMLDQCRKFGLHLCIANQHISQLREKDPRLYSSVMTNATTKIIFGGLSSPDVEVLVR